VLACALAAVAGCRSAPPPADLPRPDEVIALLERGGSSNVAATSDDARDPALRPHAYALPPVETAHAVVDAIDSLPRWEVMAGRSGVIWATRRTRFLRFVDDVYLLLLPSHDSTVIYARSASRAGRYDFGQNRRNLAELWAALDRSAERRTP
jgi:uncharacterized protein (DUF1499 family)